eukprot:gnl/TRDRNA2_/TRDRNA2_120481_c0_seq1.p1 gnl/TRDRNA2_/TRDRNA2_120481_c0~~gnl/TRDRNA2_/TRDRNA2_120481_c0_seq1.p1  ORF type:complete len:487 (-),score=100.63 gnl/TRDRNA2_/TRDRNA2_120481_c0_seq1:98-1507(-)
MTAENWDSGRWSLEDDADPFAEEEAEKNDTKELYEGETNVIDFDRYDHIPIEVQGDNPPSAINKFTELASLPKELVANIERCKYDKPTPVQKHAIPILIAGRDLMACAQTGSGKTAGFMFPIINNILSQEERGAPYGERMATPLALIITPTRELAGQIFDETRKFTYLTGLRPVVIYGGSGAGPQLRELERGCDILIATPGRLNDLIERERLSLEKVKYLTLDEADRMLDLGFEPQIRNVVHELGMPTHEEGRQTAMFSATFPDEIQRLAEEFLTDRIFLTVGRVGSTTDLIVQSILYVGEQDKRSVLMDVLQLVNGRTLIFTETKREADAIESHLCSKGIAATSIHGDRSQQEREFALYTFKKGETPVLVATDVAARGLDIPGVMHVINYDLPSNIDDYVHRIGRTGRAGKKGMSTAFFSDKDGNLARDLKHVMEECQQDVPEWLSNLAEQSRFGMGKGSGRFRRRFR